VQQAFIRQVRERAGNICEYCRLPQELTFIQFEIDHIVAQKHHGPTVLENLALACFYCNSNKGPNIAGIDPESGELSALFNPRIHRWADHFQWQGPLLVGVTSIGRTTIDVLEINSSDYVRLRESLADEGLFP
jgi:hypothetical protein